MSCTNLTISISILGLTSRCIESSVPAVNDWLLLADAASEYGGAQPIIAESHI